MKFFGRAAKLAERTVAGDGPAFEGAIDNQWGPVVHGWAKVADCSQPVLVMIRADGELHYVVASELREDVRARGKHPTGQCGFSLNLGRRLNAPAEVSAFSYEGDIAPSRPAFVNKPIFFMHIAKTAGSSVNKFFIDHFGRDNATAHIEWVKDPAMLDKHQFISGHITLAQFERDFDTKHFYTATMVRDPVRQLVSHLNWVRHLSEPEKADFLNGHPPDVRDISAKLWRLDFSDPASLANFVANLEPSERSLFDNRQCRYFHAIPAARRYDEMAFKKAEENLSRFDFVGLTENFEPAIRYLAGRAGIVKAWEKAPRANVNKFDYGFDIKNPQLVTAVEPLIRYDQALYRRARIISQALLEANAEPLGVKT